MDPQNIDRQYAELQQQVEKTTDEITALAEKLRGAAQSGNQDAREWMLDLKEITLAIQAEQNQVGALLQALHGFVVNQAGQTTSVPQAAPEPWAPPAPTQPWTQPPSSAGYASQSPYPQQSSGSMSGMLGNFMNSGFGRAISMGAGFGIGDDLINSIFGGFGRRGW